MCSCFISRKQFRTCGRKMILPPKICCLILEFFFLFTDPHLLICRGGRVGGVIKMSEKQTHTHPRTNAHTYKRNIIYSLLA